MIADRGMDRRADPAREYLRGVTEHLRDFDGHDELVAHLRDHDVHPPRKPRLHAEESMADRPTFDRQVARYRSMPAFPLPDIDERSFEYLAWVHAYWHFHEDPGEGWRNAYAPRGLRSA